MRLFTFTCLAIILSFTLAMPAFGQEEAKGANDTKKAEAGDQVKTAKLTKEDIAAFEPLLIKYLNAEKSDDKINFQGVLLKAMEDYSEKNKVSSPVADVEAWLGMFGRHNAVSLGKRKVYGTGRIKTEEFTLSSKGEHLLYEYSIYVPKDYDPAKSWPVLLCLHDKEAKDLGKSYIKKVWHGTKESKALCDQFIMIVPHIPNKLPRKKVKVVIGGKKTSVKTSSKKIDWFNSYHLRSMVLPLHELRKTYNCDPTRIFIEGVGEGADAALALAAMTPGRFAGVIARHGKLRDPKLIKGLQFTPTLFMMRDGGIFSEGAGAESWKMIEEESKGETKYTSLQVETFPTLGKNKKPTLKMLANQATDPILEANGMIAEFLTKHSMDPAPKEIRITSNNRIFRSHALLKVTEHDIAEGKILDCRAKFDREKNTVELTGENFYRVSLFLNDTVLDLSKPIQILVNGRQVDARVPDRSAKRMLRTFDKSRTDFHRALTSLIVVPRFSLEAEKKDDKEKKDDAKSDDAKK
ncbi:MAG: hypothetical protein ACI97A_004413 [Planctomycetota bacterium]|jgi:hypothetical protein